MAVLAERERELAAISRLLRDEGGVLVVEGGAGIGKTSLLEEACAGARARGHQVARARGSELEAGFAFGVVRQLFERRLAGTAPDERATLLAGPAPAAAPLLTGQPARGGAHDTSFAVLHGFVLARGQPHRRAPLLIAVDAAHCADEASLRWLAYLAPRIGGLPLTLAVAVRPLDPAATGAPLLAVRAEAAIVRPALLSLAAVGAFVGDALGPDAGDELSAAIHEASGGNPFWCGELLRAIRDDGRAPGRRRSEAAARGRPRRNRPPDGRSRARLRSACGLRLGRCGCG